MKKVAKRIVSLLLAMAVTIGLMAVEKTEVYAANYVVGTTNMECSVWTAPNSIAKNRVKKVPAGYSITVDPTVITGTDGKHYYKTKKGSYIMTKCIVFPESLLDYESYKYGTCRYWSDRSSSLYKFKPGLNSKSRTDSMGNEYLSCIETSQGSEDETWNLGKKYTNFTAVIAWSKQGKGSRSVEQIRIYGDGILLWSTDCVDQNTKPYAINVDITGVEDLQICMYGYGYAMIANPTIYKCVQ